MVTYHFCYVFRNSVWNTAIFSTWYQWRNPCTFWRIVYVEFNFDKTKRNFIIVLHTTRRSFRSYNRALKFTCFSPSNTVATNAVPIPKQSLYDPLITVDTTSLDQHKLYFCTKRLWNLWLSNGLNLEIRLGHACPWMIRKGNEYHAVNNAINKQLLP